MSKGSNSPGADARLSSLTFMLEKLGIGFKSLW